MESIDVKGRILEIASVFAMKDEGLARAMGITVGVVRKNKSDKVDTHKFNEKNLADLIAFLRENVAKL